MPEATSDFAARGPYAVGVMQATIASPLAADGHADPARVLPTEIWYPALAGASPGEEAVHPLGLPHRARHRLEPIAALCPLVAFSHGNSGLRQQSTFLTTHLASWGMLVEAPDHVGNTLAAMMALTDDEARKSTHRRIRAQRPFDLRAAITALVDHDALSSALPPIDTTRIGALGHSFGGWTALKLAALEDRVSAVCGLAPVAEPFVGRKAFDPGELPLPDSVRSLVLAARDDVLVDLETSIQPLAARLGPRSILEIIDRADHFHFCDGIPMLHTMHENNPRENQPRATRPLAELRGEDEMHRLVNERVTRFFAERFGLAKAAAL